MSWESPQFRTSSLTLLAAGIAVLFLSLSLAHSFPASPQPDGGHASSSEDLPFLVPALVGGLLIFIGGIRVSLFARPWNLVIAGTLLLLASWFAPLDFSAVPALKDFSWNRPAVLVLFLLRILGIILSTTGAIRLLRKEPTAGQAP